MRDEFIITTEVRSYSMYDTFPLWGKITMWVAVLGVFFASMYLVYTTI